MFPNPVLTSNYTSPYMTGNVLFADDKLYSPLNNTVKQIDLLHHQCHLLPFQTLHQIRLITLNAEGSLLVAVDLAGYSVVFNLKGAFTIAEYHFREPISQALFSKDGQLFAVATDFGFCIYQAPPLFRTFQPFVLLKKYKNRHTAKISRIAFSPDCRFLLTGGQDHMIYVNNLFPIPGFMAITFEVHRYCIISMQFSHDMKYIYSIDSGSNVFVWKWVEDHISQGYHNMIGHKKRILNNRKGNRVEQQCTGETQQQCPIEPQYYSDFQRKVNKGRFILDKKHIVTQAGAYLKRTYFVAEMGFLVCAYSNGKFSIYKMVEEQATEVQTFSIGSNKISSIAVNRSCSWLAIGIKGLGQLIVWQWKSQSYILNQRGLIHETRAVAYNKGKYLATGTFEGTVKIIDQKSSLIVATFDDHQAAVTDLKFSNQQTLFSSSKDGYVNAYDMLKFKNFRKMRADKTVQFQCLECDESGQIVFAGAFDPYEIYSWSLETGNLLQIIGGHEGPITCLAMQGEQLMSGSWDRQLKVYEVFSKQHNVQTLDHGAEVTAMAVNPTRTEVAVSTMNGEIYLWNWESAELIGIIQSQMKGGRSYFSKISQQNDQSSKYIKALAYSACGKYLFGGGKSNYLMVYDVRQRGLVSRIPITKNRDLQKVVEKLNSKYIQNGVETYQLGMQVQQQYHFNSVPGSKKLDISQVRMKLQVDISKIVVKSRHQLIVCTSFGVLLFSSSPLHRPVFTPIQLSLNLTPQIIPQLVQNKQYSSAIVACLKLGISLFKMLHKIPIQHVKSTVAELDHKYLQLIVEKLCEQSLDFRTSVWVQHILSKGPEKLPRNVRTAFEDIEEQVKIIEKNKSILEMATTISRQ